MKLKLRQIFVGFIGPVHRNGAERYDRSRLPKTSAENSRSKYSIHFNLYTYLTSAWPTYQGYCLTSLTLCVLLPISNICMLVGPVVAGFGFPEHSFPRSLVTAMNNNVLGRLASLSTGAVGIVESGYLPAM